MVQKNELEKAFPRHHAVANTPQIKEVLDSISIFSKSLVATWGYFLKISSNINWKLWSALSLWKE